MAELTEIVDHQAQAIARLTTIFKDKPKIAALLSAFVSPTQDIEAILYDLFGQRSIDTAVGYQLDILGEIVGVKRKGRSDSDYRLAIIGKIAINTSEGTSEDLIAIFNFLTGSVKSWITFVYPAEVGIYADKNLGGLNVEEIYNICQSIIAGGVKLFGIGSYNSDGSGDPTFAFDGDAYGNVAGFGDVNDPSIGGKFATLYYVGPIEP